VIKTRHRRIVLRFQEHVAANISKPIYSAELSRQLGVSERTLYTAVVSYLRLSPHRYIHFERLRTVREILKSGILKAKISAVARDCGFNHLGEFSKAYLVHFGEHPSETVLEARPAKLTQTYLVDDRRDHQLRTH